MILALSLGNVFCIGLHSSYVRTFSGCPIHPELLLHQQSGHEQRSKLCSKYNKQTNILNASLCNDQTIC